MRCCLPVDQLQLTLFFAASCSRSSAIETLGSLVAVAWVSVFLAPAMLVPCFWNSASAAELSGSFDAHAKQVAGQGLATLRDAARIGNTTLKTYDEARARGTVQPSAGQEAAQTVAQRYDDRGRDTQRQARQLSQSMSR